MRAIPPLACLLALTAAGCTADNPRACGPGDPCRDPAFPFCDINGAVAGLPGDCLAVTCTPAEFVACDGDNELSCDSSGANYETRVCERGCDPTSGGCRLCDPNETACTNGTVATCDANGAVVSSTPCPLGCFESEPRCRQVDPSNDLATYLDMAASAPPIDAVGPLVVDTLSGTILSSDTGGTLGIPSFQLPAPSGGVAIRIFVTSRATIGDLSFSVDQNFNSPPPAAVFVSAGDIVIGGTINAGIGYAAQDQFGPYSPGSLISGPCAGHEGRYIHDPNADYVIGAGGGGNGSAGSNGGGIPGPGTLDGAIGGAANGDASIEPLAGGCAGGGLRNTFTGAIIANYTGGGGGALQLVSATSIRLEAGASILANGAGGYQAIEGGAAGGAGGSILLEAPSVSLAPGSAITANGGSGAGGDRGSSNTSGHDGGRTTSRAPSVTPSGAVCAAPAECGSSGSGGALEGPPTDGEGITFDNQHNRYAGGGGGAPGRIRINTADASFTQASDAIISPAASTGTLRTR